MSRRSDAAGEKVVHLRDGADRLTCPHGEACGACALLGIGYAEQMRRKGEILGRAMREYAALRDTPLLACLPSPLIAGYRNRAKMAVGLSRHGGATVGYFQAGSRQIVDAPDCRVLLPALLDTTRRLRRFILATPAVPRELRHFDLRCGSDPARQHLTLVLRATKCPPLPLDRLRRALPAVDGISANLNPDPGPQVLRGPIVPLWGEREVWVEYAGLSLRVSPGAFFQVNFEILPAIHRLLAEFLGEGRSLGDLYAGVGTHGLALRSGFRRVFFVEGARPAVADLKSTLSRHGLTQAEVVATPVERGLERLRALEPEALVLNPSRAGVRGSVVDAVAASTADRLAYLSCDPATLCRDLELLVRRGFEVDSVRPIDMMPQTQQVEALALLRRGRPRPGPRKPRAAKPGGPAGPAAPQRRSVRPPARPASRRKRP